MYKHGTELGAQAIVKCTFLLNLAQKHTESVYSVGCLQQRNAAFQLKKCPCSCKAMGAFLLNTDIHPCML